MANHPQLLYTAMWCPLAAASSGSIHCAVVLYTAMWCPLAAASSGSIHYAVVLYTTCAVH